MTTTILLVVGCFAFLAAGSFVCVVIDRLPYRRDEPDEYGDIWGTRPWSEVVRGTSRCSSCHAPIHALDNVPVASYVALRGRCRACGAHIPVYHPLVELAAPVAFVLALWALGPSWLLLPVGAFIPMALVVAVIDLRTLIVPTAVVWPGTALVVVASVAAVALMGDWGRLGTALVGVAVVAGPLFLLWFAVPSGMGFGDVRLSVVVGWLVGICAGTRPLAGVVVGVVTLLAASVLAIVIGVVALGVRGRGVRVPFGPSFVLAGFAVALLAPEVLEPWGQYAA